MIFSQKTVKSAGKGNAFPLGVRIDDGVMNVAVSAPGVSWCRILVREYRKTEQYMPWMRYELQPAPVFAGIFTGRISLKHGIKYEYIFENTDGYFLDERAKKINHNDIFGGFLGVYPEKPDSDITKILSDTMSFTCMADETSFDWGDDCQPDYDYSEMVLYKLHVRGFTVHASSGVAHPGSYRGITEKIPYLKKLGINGIILQPCVEFNEFMDFGMNVGAGIFQDMYRSRLRPYSCKVFSSRINFWGYGAQSLYFAPKASYASDPDNVCTEFREMVKKLHHAGIEVIMEMDYGWNAEASFVLDNLIFWVREYHIDGFRINVDQVPVRLITGNPYLSSVKIIGQSFSDNDRDRQKTNIKKRIAVANDDFQNTVRRFLKGDEGQLQHFSELFMKGGNDASVINYMADHDGFTLNDVYSYDERHNEKNGERNRDGRDANYSWNCGAEGPTKKRKILELRNRMLKNALTVLFLSHGTPMICAGDEFGNTHFGNNNPYCCDNEQGWVIWEKTKRSADLRNFCRKMIELRFRTGVLHGKELLQGRDSMLKGLPDVSYHGIKAWNPDFCYYARTLGILLNGEYSASDSESVYIACNMHWDEHCFGLPEESLIQWNRVLSTSFSADETNEADAAAGNGDTAETNGGAVNNGVDEDSNDGAANNACTANGNGDTAVSACAVNNGGAAGNDACAANNGGAVANNTGATAANEGVCVGPRSITVFFGKAVKQTRKTGKTL